MLNGEKIYLRKITKDDTKDIVKWRNTPFVRKCFIYREHFTEEIHNNWLTNMVNTGKVHQFMIIMKENNTPIGSVFLRDIDDINHKAEYGIFIGEEAYCGKGIGTEAAELLLKYAFDELKLHKVTLRVLAENQRAIRNYKKVGFTEEGCFYDDVCIDGRFYDVIYMAKIKNV